MGCGGTSFRSAHQIWKLIHVQARDPSWRNVFVYVDEKFDALSQWREKYGVLMFVDRFELYLSSSRFFFFIFLRLWLLSNRHLVSVFWSIVQVYGQFTFGRSTLLAIVTSTVLVYGFVVYIGRRRWRRGGRGRHWGFLDMLWCRHNHFIIFTFIIILIIYASHSSNFFVVAHFMGLVCYVSRINAAFVGIFIFLLLLLHLLRLVLRRWWCGRFRHGRCWEG